MLQLKNIYKTYRSKNGVTHRALNNVSLTFEEKGLVFIVGRSGGGKSTLLNIISALDKPDKGEILLYGNSFANFKQSDYDSYRNTYVGVIFQEYNLIPTLTVYQNIALALGLQGEETDGRVDDVMKKLNITEISDRKPNQISGGQCQRVAIARAIIKDPKMIIADEPTGNLDSKTGNEMFQVFKELSGEKLVIIVTHDRDIADEIGDRIIEIKDGRIHKDIIRTTDIYESAIDLVGDRLIRVPKGKKLDDIALEEINGILDSSDRDSYIINESDTAKVKSMNIHVKNAVDLKIDTEGTNYFPYRDKPQEKREISLIKAKMPLSVGFKLSLSTLKYKTFRLIITVVMLVIALTLSAVITSLSFYDAERAVAQTVNKEGFDTVLVKKDVVYFADAAYTNEDVEGISKFADKTIRVNYANYSPEYVDCTEKYTAGDKSQAIFRDFYGIAEVNDISDIGRAAYAGKSSLQSYDEVIISQFAAKHMIDSGIYKDVLEYEDLLGNKLKVAGKTLTIAGVFNSDMSILDKALRAAYNGESPLYFDEIPECGRYVYTLENTDGMLYVKTGFIDDMLVNNSVQNGVVSALNVTSAGFGSVNIGSFSSVKDKITEIECTGERAYISLGLYSELFGHQITQNDDGTLSEADMALIKENIAGYNGKVNAVAFEQKAISGQTGTHRSLIYNDVNICGVVAGDELTVYISNEDYGIYAKDSLQINALLIGTGGSVGKNRTIINELKKYDSVIGMSFVSEYESLKSVFKILNDPLIRALIITSLLAAVLLFSFVSASIKLEGRQIGILRGMGARGIDTFKTFGIEGALISLFSLLISVSVIAVIFPIINSSVSASHAYSFFALTINPLMALTLVLTAVLITVLGVAIPLIRLIKLTPVEATNKNENQR